MSDLSGLHREVTRLDLGSGHRVGWLDSGDLLWMHQCGDGTTLTEIDLTSGQYHQLITREPLHIEASVLCRECGAHGWIRDGGWVSA